MLRHFNSIITMASNAAKQAKLPMAAESETLTNDENAPKKKSFLSYKTTSVAANCAPPRTIRTDFPDLIRLGIYFGIYLSVGTTSFYALRDHIRGKKTNDFIDSLYLCVVTMTTVGYGDLVPHSFLSQLICSVFITVGMCLFGIVVKIAANYLVMKQQMVLINALHMAQKIGPMEALKEIESLKIDYTKCLISLIAMAVHFVIGIFILVTVEGMDFTDAVYCVCTTMTTVGFGDESFSTESGRMFGIIWISTGTSCLGQLFLYIAEIYTDIETRKLIKWVISNKIIAKKDLEAADHVEDDKVYGAADFILYKLKEMGKIKQEDISFAMKDIDDVIKDLYVANQSVSDMIPAQSSQNK
ncbi:two-pore potassium channel 1-like [Durio zibethinus]|uniref:Two-pore potassium channel 1-like n=1 Tax=Durio zibethinus TaxID=66656 RepID=A0A6P5WQA7_DURZI|nr:two-pore potassium channel 1-like [Durio zibethinus]XP_022717887.1 two-pore potassium channel 1-like [Durio zibethinus]